MQITVTVNDTATEALNRLGEGLGSRETLHSVMGRAVEAGIRNHLKSEGYVGRVCTPSIPAGPTRR